MPYPREVVWEPFVSYVRRVPIEEGEEGAMGFFLVVFGCVELLSPFPLGLRGARSLVMGGSHGQGRGRN
jgi:hypothetical protein